MAKKAITGCITYFRGEVPFVHTELGQGWAWMIVITFSVIMTPLLIYFAKSEQKSLGVSMTSERFSSAGRDVGVGLTASAIVSKWVWAASLLMSCNMGWRVGVSGPFWYASGAAIPILFFSVVGIAVKRRVSHMHTFTELVKVRFGTATHIIMIVFAMMASMIVTAMLILGGASTIQGLTGMSSVWVSFTIPLLCCWLYTMYGGLKATFFASYLYTSIIFLTMLIFSLSIYGFGGDGSGTYGNPGAVYNGLTAASKYAIFDATKTEAEMHTAGSFANIGTFIENEGICYTADGEETENGCRFAARGKDEWCCSPSVADSLGSSYCKADWGDCIDISETGHYASSGCGEDERCSPSFLTMGSPSGMLFGITNIVGNFGTVFVDQSYWQSAVAAKPKAVVLGFIIGGLAWFAVPFGMATALGLAGRALTTHPDLDTMYIDADVSGGGLTPAKVLQQALGGFGAFLSLLQLLMAVISTGSAEIAAVSSILTYDIYYQYIVPELKDRRESLKSIFYFAAGVHEKAGRIMIDSVQMLMEQLTDTGFFELGGVLSDQEVTRLTSLILAYSKDMSAGAPQSQAELIAAMTGSTSKNKKNTVSILTHDLYMVVNAVMSQHGLEGKTLLRVSRLSTGLYAFFMGFVAMFLQVIGFGIGWVYMSMGVLIGSAVGPASLTLLMERANGFWVGAGAVGGFILGVMSWFICALVNSGEISYESIGSDWPWVVGNVCSIGSGFLIAFGGSMLQPNKQFKWDMLNDQIPLVDDVEPLRGDDESEEWLTLWNWVAISVSTSLTFILIVMWPIPMYFAGVFSSMGFTLWTVVSILWILVAAIVILALPLWEIYAGYAAAKVIADALANADQKDILNKDKITRGAAALAAEAAAKEQAKEQEELRAAAAAVATSTGGGAPKSGSTTPKKGTPKATPKKSATPMTPEQQRVNSNGKPV